MVRRVFDRRGRNTWDEKTRAKEDRRLVDRRRGDRRSRKDRRVAERRKHDAWADDPTKKSRRIGERRVSNRRSGNDRRKDQAAIPKTFVHELVSTSGAGIQTLKPTSLLRDAVSILAIHKIGLIVVMADEKGLVGVLSERDVISALHEQGSSALEQELSSFMTRGIWTCSPGDRLSHIKATMTENKMRHMPVMQEDKVLGVISATDLLKVVIDP